MNDTHERWTTPTPGPWRADPDRLGAARYAIYGTDPVAGQVEAYVGSVGNGTKNPAALARAKANSDLVVAAPDLLAAAEALVSYYEEFAAKHDFVEFDQPWVALYTNLGAAVAKARGAS